LLKALRVDRCATRARSTFNHPPSAIIIEEIVTPQTITITTLAVIGTSAAVIDLRRRRVPNWLTAGTAVLGLALATIHATRISTAAAVWGLAVGAVVMLPGYVFGGSGAGDVKLLAAVGTLLGPGRTLSAFIYTTLAGAVLALVVAAQRGRLRDTFSRSTAFVRTGGANALDIESHGVDNRFAYAPAIVIGALLAALGA
jgi:prepilin peptidase CpaA